MPLRTGRDVCLRDAPVQPAATVAPRTRMRAYDDTIFMLLRVSCPSTLSLTPGRGHKAGYDTISMQVGQSRSARRDPKVDARMKVRSLSVVMLAALSVLVMALTVAAHAKLVRAEPRPGSSVTTPPTALRAWFNDELDTKRSTLRVIDRKGARIDRGDGRVDLDDLDRKSMVVGLKPVGPGTYTVQWTAVSADDGFVARGSYRFTIATAQKEPNPQRPSAALPPLRIASPANGATVSNPVTIVIETPADLNVMTMGGDHRTGPSRHLHIDIGKRMNMPTAKHLTKVGERRYEFKAGNIAPGAHVIRVYWSDEHHKPLGAAHTVNVTVK
jgi:copper resistance protein C